MKGICFKEHLFNTTVNKTKTQTRRIITPEPDNIRSVNKALMKEGVDYFLEVPKGTPQPAISFLTCENKYLKPRYLVGETLYLKEPYIDDSDMLFHAFPIHETLTHKGGTILYRYGNDIDILYSIYGEKAKWQNKLFMPESAARFFIKITGVRAERLQSISDEDCIKEGIQVEETFIDNKDYSTYCNGVHSFSTPKEAYEALINKINGKDTWKNNPFVWVYDYELIENK